MLSKMVCHHLVTPITTEKMYPSYIFSLETRQEPLDTSVKSYEKSHLTKSSNHLLCTDFFGKTKGMKRHREW